MVMKMKKNLQLHLVKFIDVVNTSRDENKNNKVKLIEPQGKSL